MVFSLNKGRGSGVEGKITCHSTLVTVPPTTFFLLPTKLPCPSAAGVVRLGCTRLPKTSGQGPTLQLVPPSYHPCKGCSCDRLRHLASLRNDHGSAPRGCPESCWHIPTRRRRCRRSPRRDPPFRRPPPLR